MSERKEVTCSDFRKNIGQILDSVAYTGTRVTLTKRGKLFATAATIADLNSLDRLDHLAATRGVSTAELLQQIEAYVTQVAD